MSEIEVKVYIVKHGECFDESDDSVIFTSFSKDEAERALYEELVKLSINYNSPIKTAEYSSDIYEVLNDYLYITTGTISVKE